ncbi:phage tail tape measure protein (plasmid) [Bernardetia sp. ABR2-2B]|uniref:phage tail tape measure protein n=1 Tax=Bernardetia sp. ABR2-2B TaxID=3127472 RepID=UPI0030D18078
MSTDGFGFGMAFHITGNAKEEAMKLQETFKGLIQTTDRLGKSYTDATNRMAKQSLSKLMDLGQGGLNQISDVVGLAGDFEQQMSSIKAVTQSNSKEMAAIQKEVMAASGATEFSAMAAANAYEELTKAGLDSSKILGGGLKSALDFATASGLDIVKAAKLGAGALNAFKQDGMDFKRASDLIVGAANSAGTNVSEMSYAIKQSGAVAGDLGMSFEDLNAGLGLLAQNFLTGSDAGTSLKTFLQRLQPDTKKAKAEMEKLGLIVDGNNQFFENGKVKNIEGLANALQSAYKGMSEQDMGASMKTLFGSDAIKAASVLAKNGGAGIAAVLENMKKFSSSAIAEEKLNNFNGAVTIFKSNLENLKITLGTALLAPLKSFVDIGTIAIQKMKAFAETSTGQNLMRFGSAFIGIATGAGMAIFAFAKLKTLISGLMLTFKASTIVASGFILPIIAGVTAIAGLFVTVTSGVEHFNNSLHNIGKAGDDLKPVNKVLATIGGLFTGIMTVFSSSTSEGFSLPKDMNDQLEKYGILGIVKEFGFFFAGVKKAFKEGMPILEKMLEPLFKTLSDTWQDLKPVLSELFTAFGSLFGDTDGASGWANAGKIAFGIIGVGIRYAASGLQLLAIGIQKGIEFWNKYKEEIKAVAGTVWDVIQTIFAISTAPLRLFYSLGTGLVDMVQNGFGSGWESFKTTFLQQVYDLIDMLPFGDKIFEMTGMVRPPDYKPKKDYGFVDKNDPYAASPLKRSFFEENNIEPKNGNSLSALSKMQDVNGQTTKELSKKQAGTESTQSFNTKGIEELLREIAAKPTVLEMDGRRMAEAINEVNRSIANSSY